MNVAIKMFVVLTMIALISGGLLSTFDSFTAPRIEENRQQTLKSAISEVLPEYDHYEEFKTDQSTIYIGISESTNEPVGLAFRIVGAGFQGKIAIMIGIKPDFTELTGIKILEQVETPGLGTKIVEDPSNKSDRFWFPQQFKGLMVQPQIELIKNLKPTKNNEIQAITGATITSKAVVRILNDQIQAYKNIYMQKTN